MTHVKVVYVKVAKNRKPPYVVASSAFDTLTLGV